MSKPSPTTWTEAVAACAVCLVIGYCLAAGLDRQLQIEQATAVAVK